MILMKYLITGGCGFIASHLVDSLMKSNIKIILIDNLSSGVINNIRPYLKSLNLKFIKTDLKKFDKRWVRYFDDVNSVFHFAANPEVRLSVTKPRIHYQDNILTTFNVLEACRKYDIKYLVFSSTSTVYGDAKVIPTPEDYSPLEPISVYGACKLACENLIITYSKLYGIRSLILRYANIVGPRNNHGVIVDFINKLRKNPKKLHVLGDGSQRKSYLHINDAIDATLHLFKVFKDSGNEYDIYNIGNEDWISVKEIADIIVEEMDLRNVKYIFKSETLNGRGWKGDVKFMLLDISKLKSTGWKPNWNSYETIRKAVREALRC
jgi:UDP-glucose 4-epimerase